MLIEFIKKRNWLIIMSILSILTIEGFAGDTTRVRVHDQVGWTWYGNKFQWAEFPSDTVRFEKIFMHYTLGCPTIGCSDWDYTTMILAMHPTGDIDSTLTLAPSFTANGISRDSLGFSYNLNYVYVYDSITMAMDSIAADTLFIYFFEDPLNPFSPTDSLKAWSANYYNYIFNSSGMITDSVFVGADSLLININDSIYTPFDVTTAIELGRIITPYGGNYGSQWTNTWTFDVTDYASVLNDSVRINAFYGGWQNGFTITLDFEFIEGIPPRDAIKVENLWNSGPGGFQYGNTSNPINSHLGPTDIVVPANATGAKFRFTPTGHSFGGNENCAEFCVKQYGVFVDGSQYYFEDIWRDDCGSNALFPQAGTWLYDRANWCPGERAIRRDHEITPYITAGDSAELKMEISAYTYTGGAGFHPNYIVETQVIYYDSPNFNLDAAIDAIVSPNNDFTYNRVNPICAHPEVIIKNTGTTPLTSLTIEYEIDGGTVHTFNWTGSLGFLETEKVSLGALDLNSSSSDKFLVRIMNPNGGADQYPDNNAMSSRFDRPIDYSGGPIIVHFQPNNASNDTQWALFDEMGNILYSRTAPLLGNTLYRDTLNLVAGCYRLLVNDAQKNGLSFFNFNNDGAGYIAFFNSSGQITKSFTANFGTFIDYQFTVGASVGVDDIAKEEFFDIYPNPNKGEFEINLSLIEKQDLNITVYNSQGSLVREISYADHSAGIIRVDLEGAVPGIYYVRVNGTDRNYTKRVVIQ